MKMKPNLSAFLVLFLLLLDQSLSANSAGLSSLKLLPNAFKTFKAKFKAKWIEDAQDILELYLDYLAAKKNSSDQTLPPIKGLSQIKEYLSNFGYLQSSKQFDDRLDQQTASAIKTYQRNFNLQVTGHLNNETVELISRPRCAVPDVAFDYHFSRNNVSWPKAGNQWFQKRNLTYGFLLTSKIPANATKVFRDAFTRWSQATGFLNLTETTYDEADIKVGFYSFDDDVDDDDDDNLFGFSFIRQKPPSDVKTAEIRLQANMYWALPSETGSLSWEDGVLDLESAAMHEIGHLLGLDHSFMNDSVMYPYILPSQPRKIELSNSDKSKIKQQNANASSSDGGCLGVPSMTTLSLGFAYMLLMF